jgi:predicted O-linked N-acetylglucosamine transferase (SPINDLY family)
MKYLPREYFEVYALPVARGDVKPLAPSISMAVDHVIEISLFSEHSKKLISDMNLDILIFADTMSEPMAHFLAHSRLARIQVIMKYIHLHYMSETNEVFFLNVY